MTTRFVVIARVLPKARRAITAALREGGVAWWHHFPDSWLICDKQGRTALDWRDVLTEAAPDTHLLVVEAGDAPWAGVLSETELKWIKSSWR
jgi:hypothetical protein